MHASVVEPALPGILRQVAPATHDHAAGQHGQRVHVLHEFGDISIGRPQHDVGRRAGLHDAAAFEHGNLVAQFQGFVEVVRHEQDRLLDALLQRAQFVLQLAADQRVERRKRLVHRAGCRRRSQTREPARRAAACRPTARDRIDRPISKVRPVRVSRRRCVRRCAAGSLRSSRPKPDVLAHRAPGQQPELLEDHRDAVAAQATQGRGIAAGHVDLLLAVADEHPTARDAIESVRRAHERRLAGARQPHQHRYLATCRPPGLAPQTPTTTPVAASI